MSNYKDSPQVACTAGVTPLSDHVFRVEHELNVAYQRIERLECELSQLSCRVKVLEVHTNISGNGAQSTAMLKDNPLPELMIYT